MRDQPCQKGNQPCCFDASLSNLSFAFLFTRYAYTNTHATTLFSTECGLTQCRGVSVACVPLYFKANKSIPPFHLWLNSQGQGSISSHETRQDIEGKDATQSYSCTNEDIRFWSAEWSTHWVLLPISRRPSTLECSAIFSWLQGARLSRKLHVKVCLSSTVRAALDLACTKHVHSSHWHHISKVKNQLQDRTCDDS